MTSGGRRRKGQRLLYYFRTPPAVRVGRAPIDEEAIRLLESNNPDVHFDWERILRGAPSSPSQTSSPSGTGSGFERRRDRRERREGRPSAPPPAIEEREDANLEPANLEPTEPRTLNPENPEPEEPVEPGEPEEPEAATPLEDPPSVEPRYARLGAEGLTRLRARYAEVMARISEKELADDQREQLKAQAERLNPDGWVTEDEVAAALEEYESVFEALRAVVGRHSRRPRL